MKDLIRQILREGSTAIIHDGDKDYAKNIDSINNLQFQRLESQGLSAYAITKDNRFITTIKKLTNKSDLKGYGEFNKRIDIYYLTEEQANTAKKIIDKTNEIIELKYNSIDLMSKHAIAAINEIYRKTNERNSNRDN